MCRRASEKSTVHGIHRSHPIYLNSVHALKMDLTDRRLFDKTFREIKHKAVIHTAGATDPNWCQENPEPSKLMNVTVTTWIAEWCAEKNIPLVFTSSDLVFEGTDSPYREEDPVNPVCLYEEQKVRAEQAIADIYPEALICRMPLLFGWTGSELKNFDYHMIQALRRGESVSLFSDEYRTPVDGESATRGILHFLGKAKGCFIWAGKPEYPGMTWGKSWQNCLG